MTTHSIHQSLPSGFTYANRLQAEAFERTGSVNGAAKVCLVGPRGGGMHLAIRLRPPRTWADVKGELPARSAARLGISCATARLEWYIREYNAGYKAASRSSDSSRWDSGDTSAAWDDGYLDWAAGRAKWHLTYCEDHDNCGEG